MQRSKQWLIAAATLLMVGCSNLPGMYRTDIHQGHILEEERLSNLKEGMSEADVKYLLGTPLVSDRYREGVWYYPYLHHRSNGEKVAQRNVAIYFDQKGRVTRIERDVAVE